MILAKWLKDHPEATLVALAPGQETELWKALDVKGTPTILVEDVPSGRSVILRGLAVETKLDGALAEVTKPLPIDSKEKNREKK